MIESRHIYLIGFRATGKSSVAVDLGRKLLRKVVDTDELIVRQEGRTIAEIFASGGESRFRDLEEKTLSQAASSEEPLVIATGGGIVERQANLALMKRTGLPVWLDASAEIILLRMGRDPRTASMRPSLTGIRDPRLEVEQKLGERRPLYRECSAFSVETDGCSVEQIVDRIVTWMEESQPLRGEDSD